MVVQHRKNLPSLNNNAGSAQNANRNTSKGGRGASNDSAVPVAISI